MKANKALNSFDFLRRMAQTQSTFTLQDFARSTGWTEETAETYISKKFENLIIQHGSGYRVDRRILNIRFERYESIFRQKRNLFVEYDDSTHQDVTVYEFFLPLTLEHVLRKALDELFYKDAVRDRLASIGIDIVSQQFTRGTTESDDALLDRVCGFVAEKFVGYSIDHVDGRFRVGELLSRDEAAEQEAAGKSYIIDETTAVVRFIIPHSIPRVSSTGEQLEMEFLHQSIEAEISRTNWIFSQLFVEAVLQATTDQDEIWVLRGGTGYELRRFVAREREY